MGLSRGAAQVGPRPGRPEPTPSTRGTERSTVRKSTSTSPMPSAANGSARRSSSTISMPQRFGLKYIGADNAEHQPVVIHRAIFGSFERFIAILIEHYAGAFPLWLAPLQAIGAADLRIGTPTTAGSVEARAQGGGAAGRSSTSARKKSDIRFVRPSCRRCPTCWWWATAKRPKARCRFAREPAATRGESGGASRGRSRDVDDDVDAAWRRGHRQAHGSQPQVDQPRVATIDRGHVNVAGGQLSLSTEHHAATTVYASTNASASAKSA